VRAVARFFSIVCHPLLLTTYLVLFLGHFFPPMLGINPAVLYKFTLFIFVFTFAFPALNIVMMVRFSGTLSSLQMASRRERIVPFILISVIYVGITGLFFYKEILGMNFNRLMAIVAALVLTATVLTFFLKVSVHSLAMGGFVGMLLPMNRILADALILPTAIVIILTGVVMSSRLALNAHTLREVVVGVLAGFVVGVAGMMILF
jgi:membrane-associated phospholipid phosphatase